MGRAKDKVSGWIDAYVEFGESYILAEWFIKKTGIGRLPPPDYVPPHKRHRPLFKSEPYPEKKKEN